MSTAANILPIIQSINFYLLHSNQFNAIIFLIA